MSHEILRYTAFSNDPTGGNPAGIVLDARGMDEAAMQRVRPTSAIPKPRS